MRPETERRRSRGGDIRGLMSRNPRNLGFGRAEIGEEEGEDEMRSGKASETSNRGETGNEEREREGGRGVSA
ncbi:hypothetical protein B296_00053680 [Ensete ventricosum]|uniref:Uncharacterized protein n=1 Tax=Ensete ventricosum TaxID=4639 RepID=A0A426X9V2_ENSVE|nr:hypothetical protein B296_00053680 [Ensete ventricosum]